MAMPLGFKFSHCRKGHAMTPENVVLSGNSRTCLACRRVSSHRSNAKRPQDYWKTHRDPVNAAWCAAQRGNRPGTRARFRAFALPRELFEDLVTDNCFYCGAAPDPINGIDRVDNAQPYVEGNVVTACRWCNRAKLDRTREDFESWAIGLGRNLARFTPAKVGYAAARPPA